MQSIACACLLCILPLTHQEPSAADWVAKLGGDQGAEAERALIAMRRDAIPALRSGFETGELGVRRGVLRVARGLGSQAAELAPTLAQCFTEPGLEESLAWEIAPTIKSLGTGATRAAAEWSKLLAASERSVEQRGWAILSS